MSSMVTTFACCGMKKETAFMLVVFPEPVPPANSSDLLFSMASQK